MIPLLCSVSLRPIGKEVSQDSGTEVYMRESMKPDWELTEKKHREGEHTQTTQTQRHT